MVAVYVWDYAGKMELMRYFWDAAVALDHEALALDEGLRLPASASRIRCAELFTEARLDDVAVRAIVVTTAPSAPLTTTGRRSSAVKAPRPAT